MWRCLVIEDDRENARYVASGLSELGHVAVVCHEGVEALDRAIKSSWDVIILDRMLPHGVDGLSILATLRSLGKKTPVLVLSALTALDDRISGLDAGGDDYLVKPFAFSELLARLKALVRRSRAEGERRTLQVADLNVDLSASKVERAGRAIVLQPREFRLLAYLMLNAHNVVTRTMLLEEVWDYRFDPQSNVIDVQVSRLRRKVDSEFSTALIHTVRGAGYMLSDRCDSVTASRLP
ncbi:response regulator transcription factor [Allopusillimonas ginsengisoli]|uniref:winged helix-turn-helix domain-containing protein n=1 Tax=Allopusillimonas ginsengisoli TaxID=453575 RepID=UPI0010209CCA|nr:response regulator transcription factor [Allopusillimonas ginsengisoli]TEA78360.1 response regulator transcription factor [Allopusillimonas ginsengisoli]